jgi:hypothetical protein
MPATHDTPHPGPCLDPHRPAGRLADRCRTARALHRAALSPRGERRRVPIRGHVALLRQALTALVLDAGPLWGRLTRNLLDRLGEPRRKRTSLAAFDVPGPPARHGRAQMTAGRLEHLHSDRTGRKCKRGKTPGTQVQHGSWPEAGMAEIRRRCSDEDRNELRLCITCPGFCPSSAKVL